MNPPSPLSTPEAWNLVSADYAAEIVPQFELFARSALDLAGLQSGERVLDVATGPGLALLAARQGARVSAIDFATGMVEQLRQRSTQQSLSVDVRVGDGQALPFAEDSFDAAFSMFGLMFFPDRAAGMRELVRVLRPAGRAVISSWAPFEGPFALIMESIQALLPGVPFGRSGPPPLGDPRLFEAELKAAGFDNVRVESVTHQLKSPSLASFWETVERTTAPLVLLRKKIGEEPWRKLSAEIHGRLRDAMGEGEVIEVASAYLGIGFAP